MPFGGVSILLFGDMLQLRPVLGAFPFEKPKNPEFAATYELEGRWKMFRILNLEINHRQGEDKDYAEILNRMRVGKMTDNDIEKMKTRCRDKGHADLKSVDLFIVPTRKMCARYNEAHLNSLDGEEIHLKATHFHPMQKNYKPFIDSKEGAIGTTSFLDNLKVKIGSKIILVHNIDTADGLTNGQLGTLISIIKSDDGRIDKLVVRLQKKSAGSENRKKYPGLAQMYPGMVIIDRVSINYSIRKKGGAIGSTATLVQFPIKLAHAITAHKVQGQTIPKPLKVAFHIMSIFEEAQGYVMLSRVQELEQIYILDQFNHNKIYPSEKALKEVDRMNRVSINENPSAWNQNTPNTLKILSMNCAGLKSHYEEIKRDYRVTKADIIHLAEISLEESDSGDQYSLEGYTKSLQKKGMGKGIGTYVRKEKVELGESVSEIRFQINQTIHVSVDIIGIYRSQGGSAQEVLNQLVTLIDEGRDTLVVGDFNICYRENINNRLIQGLLNMQFRQLVYEPTHIRGRIIDHVYFRSGENLVLPTVERYSPYYSDHDALCINLKLKKDCYEDTD